MSGSPELIKEISDLLQERFYVPIWRATDNTVPPVVGEPFSTNDPPKLEVEKHGPQMKIKAYAGPMDKEQAQVFKKRLKTPPRLIASTSAPSSNMSSPYKRSPIPQASPLLSPTKFKHNLLNNNYSSTPVSTPHRGRKLFTERLNLAEDDTDEDLTPTSDDVQDFQNGNVNHGVNGDSLGTEKMLDNDTMTQQKPVHAVDRFFREYRDDQHNESSLLDTSFPNTNQSFNYICEETSSVYDPLSVITSPPVKERLVRITDPEKGVETIGRELAKTQNIGWKEYWKFLDKFVDLSSKDGLEMFEEYLKKGENASSDSPSKPLNVSSIPNVKNNADDSIFALCARLNTLNLNKEEGSTPKGKNINETIKLLQERRTLQLDVITNNNHIANPYLSIEKALQVYAKRTSFNLTHTTTTELKPILEQEIKKLEKLVLSFINDQRFVAVNLKKSHSRYGHLIYWYLKNDVPFLSPGNLQKIFKALEHSTDLKCIVKSFTTGTNINPHSLNTEQECIEAWRLEPQCDCSFVEPEVSDVKLMEMRRKRRKLRLGLWHHEKSGKEKPIVAADQIWKARTVSNSDDEQDSGTTVEEDDVYYVS